MSYVNKPGQWTEKDIADIVTNPVYIGIGPFPKIIDEEQFIRANKKAIKEMGEERYLRTMLNSLKSSFEWYMNVKDD